MNKTKIIADSGSTKTDWVIIDHAGNHIDKIRTIGFNPYFQNTELIYNEVKVGFERHSAALEHIEDVHFYGAGCSSTIKNQIVKDALQPLFKNAQININHDLEAAAVATLGDQDGIACIIGTGSNSCVWENNEVVHNIPSHGYIFGDEASGSYLGIQLLKKYLAKQLASDLIPSFETTFMITSEEILHNAYRESSPNVFLAKFAIFYSMHHNHPQLQSILENGFRKFFEVRILPYTNYQNYHLGFVGSIAYYFREALEKVVSEYGMHITNITQCPIDNLVAYHSNRRLK